MTSKSAVNNGQVTGNLVQGDVGGNVIANIPETSKGPSKEEKTQTPAEALKEIEELLKQLEAKNPTATEAEKIAFLETSPNFKDRVVAALKAAGDTSIEEFLDNPYVNVAKATVKGWVQAQ